MIVAALFSFDGWHWGQVFLMLISIIMLITVILARKAARNNKYRRAMRDGLQSVAIPLTLLSVAGFVFTCGSGHTNAHLANIRAALTHEHYPVVRVHGGVDGINDGSPTGRFKVGDHTVVYPLVRDKNGDWLPYRPTVPMPCSGQLIKPNQIGHDKEICATPAG